MESFDLLPDDGMERAVGGEWIRYSDHVEAMKRIAGDSVAQGLTDEAVYSILRNYGVDRKDSDNMAHDLRLAQAAPSASAQQAEPIYQYRHRNEVGELLSAAWMDCEADEYATFAQWPEIERRIVYTAPAPCASPAKPVYDCSTPDCQCDACCIERGESGPFNDVEDRAPSASPAECPECEGPLDGKTECHYCYWKSASPAALTDEQIFSAWIEAGKTAGDNHQQAVAMVRALLAASHADQVEDAPAAARDVLAERRRQVEEEGWTPEHDDKYMGRAMAAAAGCYAIYSAEYHPPGNPPGAWPWLAHWWKPSTPRRNLIKAGALILAEIERLDCAAMGATQPAAEGK